MIARALQGRLLPLTFARLAGLPPAVAAADEDAPDYAATTLSGDWGGARSALWKQGITLEAGLQLDRLRNRGALSNGSKTVSHIDLKLRMDLEKLPAGGAAAPC